MFGFANFTPVQVNGKYIVDAPSQGPHSQFCLLSLLGSASASHLIVSIDPGILLSPFLTWSLLQQGNLKKTEDTVSSTRLRIRMQVEQAMNEVIELFFFHFHLSLFPQTVPVASERVSDPTRCYGEK